jgi:hypothetical protein
VIFRDRKFSLECWTHNLLELLKRADLEGALDQAVQQNQPLGQNWLAVKDWSEASRYQQWTPAQAQNLVDAVGHANDGVLTWVRNHW